MYFRVKIFRGLGGGHFGKYIYHVDVDASNMAPIGLKLFQNAFQTIPDISFFDAQKFFSAGCTGGGGGAIIRGRWGGGGKS